MYKPSQQPVVVMYSSHNPVTTSMNGLGANSFDDSNNSSTINPHALDTSVPLPAPGHTYDSRPRGHKRSRSPDSFPDGTSGPYDDDHPSQKKRGRPRKDTKSSLDSPVSQSPQSRPPGSSHGMPVIGKAGPPKPPTKTVIKALPTVRDHTTDTLNPERDEFIPREFDTEGEKKVSQDGRPLGGREYRVRTFLVPNRGDKLFMLATECARALAYRDSYLLFNKNRSLYKIIANQTEKDDLIQQEILPYSYRSRQIAIVTARSMFRQFGSRLIEGGRRVRDDYWEAKARKQGFTEEDLAGEKRPGGARAAREAQEAANAANMAAAAAHHHQDIVYSNNPQQSIPLDVNGAPQFMHGMGGHLGHGSLPMIRPQDELSMRGDYAGIPRGPRQEMTGIPYSDRLTASSNAELISQTTHAAEFNKVVNAQSKGRAKQTDDFYKQPRDITSSGILQPGPESPTSSNAQVTSVQPSAGLIGASPQVMMGPQMTSSSHAQMYPHPQSHSQQSPPLRSSSQLHPAASSSPSRAMQPQLPPHQVGLGYASSSAVPQASYAYPPQHPPQMWPAQPQSAPHQQSPVSQQHGLPGYPSQGSHGPPPHQAGSPHQHAQPSSHLQHSQSGAPLHSAMGYQQMPGYASQNSMYRPQQTGSPHGYMQSPATATGTAPQQWAPPGQQGHTQSWSGY